MKFDKDVDRVLAIIGIAEPVDSIALIDDILNDRLDDATLTIARKLSIMHPHIVIQKEAETKKDEQGREVVASVLVSANNEAIFGTNNFNYQTIRITAYPGYNAYPDKFIFTIAHELCHKILHSLDRDRRNDEQDERETDIAAVLSGFGNSYAASKNVDEGLGYLKIDEAQYLKHKADKTLARIKEARSRQYREYVQFRQRYEEKIRFLNALYDAGNLRTESEWEIDYAEVGEDFVALIVRPVIGILQGIEGLLSQGAGFFLHRNGHFVAHSDAGRLGKLAVVDADGDVFMTGIRPHHILAAVHIVSVEIGHVPLVRTGFHGHDIAQFKAGGGKGLDGDIQPRVAVLFDFDHSAGHGGGLRENSHARTQQRPAQQQGNQLFHIHYLLWSGFFPSVPAFSSVSQDEGAVQDRSFLSDHRLTVYQEKTALR